MCRNLIFIIQTYLKAPLNAWGQCFRDFQFLIYIGGVAHATGRLSLQRNFPHGVKKKKVLKLKTPYGSGLEVAV